MSKKTGYKAHTPFTFTHDDRKQSSFKVGDDVPKDVAEHFFGAAHSTATGDTPDKSPEDFNDAVQAEVNKRLLIERERIDAEAADYRKKFAEEWAKNHPAAPIRDEAAEKKAAADAASVASGKPVAGSSGTPAEQKKTAEAQAEAAGKPAPGRRGT